MIPSSGGNTEFADMRTAYDALSAEDKAEVADLVCEHSIVFSRAQIGLEVKSEEHAEPRARSRHCERCRLGTSSTIASMMKIAIAA